MQTISLTFTSAPLFSSISLLKETQRQGKYKSELDVLDKEKALFQFHLVAPAFPMILPI